MGVLARFEKRLGTVVEGTFAKVFRGRVEPVELAAAIAREADTNKAVGPHRVLVPNVYTIDLGPTDFARLAPYAFTLGDELAEMLREHALEQGYSFVGPVVVRLAESDGLSTGSYRLASRVEAGDDEPGAVAGPGAGYGALEHTGPESVGGGGPADVELAPAALPPVPPFLPPVLAPPLAPPLSPPLAGGLPGVPEPAGTFFTTALPRQEPAPASTAFGRLELADGTLLPIGPGPVVLGRGLEADIRLADASVSRRHARISRDSGSVLVEDLQSTNGTSVNGKAITRAALGPGDRLMLGAAVVVFRS